MTHRDPWGPVEQHPTPFPELDALVVELVERAREILGSSFVGAYLQGSAALGDLDEASDCDFLVPVRGPIDPEQEAGLRRLHDEIPTRLGQWSTELEGSYPEETELRSVRSLGRPWLYIDRGSREMQWSTHCNTEVVRWILRERGITLAGPDPRTLVDEVPGDLLRARMRTEIPRFLTELQTWTTFDIAWAQRYAVATYCRMLQTLHSGRVTSKRAALLWGREALDPGWEPLLTQVLEDRPLPWDAPPRPGSVAETLRFARYAEELAAAPTLPRRDR
ncbi:aminoglycoside adenylyltransferase domain-containing protein [Candidatus Blastococcus massiliensis]|uniref:aminoglycoside adenylyltransferase domain-containing protein n=1 Tax=Candidatus Blastococcus massiliensis TaxID=1470358 RepID=UPI0004AF0445|nr:aminoglycoside adenylyltransferase domain-containing protein [Candidatus Blastococcus massiliensis]